ncbi:hypothetical protein TURU_096095 [Turdus rufiventris]|nr:hypothetical protein TURU_096095 [Turdus rufiventris]
MDQGFNEAENLSSAEARGCCKAPTSPELLWWHILTPKMLIQILVLTVMKTSKENPPKRLDACSLEYLSFESPGVSSSQKKVSLSPKWKDEVDVNGKNDVLHLSCDNTAQPGTAQKRNVQKRGEKYSFQY